MCLILFDYQPTKESFLVMANRDEYLARPTLNSGYHFNNNQVIAGLDLIGNGTWMGFNENGKFAAITNYRDPKNFNKDAPSRGPLVRDFLENDLDAKTYLEIIKNSELNYNGFNLIVKDVTGLFYINNLHYDIQQLPAGSYGLSNAFLNTAWPKVEKGILHLKKWIKEPYNTKKAFKFLRDNEKAEDQRLPTTGVSLEMERILSPMCIQSPDYGTRTSTIYISEKNRYYWEEKNLLNKEHNVFKGRFVNERNERNDEMKGMME